MITKYSEFQKKTSKKDFSLQYLTLGLVGEVGEVANEIKKLERDDNNVLTPDRENKIILELGDTMWYFFGICNKLNININNILDKNIKKINN